MTRVFFLSRTLGLGGAQRQLLELVRTLDKSKFEVTVAVFYPGGNRWRELEAFPEIRRISLQKKVGGIFWASLGEASGS